LSGGASIAEYGIAWLLPRVVGHESGDRFFSSREEWFDAEEALRIGLLDYVVNDTDVVSSAIDYANELADSAHPHSMATMQGSATSLREFEFTKRR